MKIIILSLLSFILFACSTSKVATNKKQYFNHNNIAISKSEFNKIRATNKYLEVPGDSIHDVKLINRIKQGRINNRSILESLLRKGTNQEIDESKPLVVLYYPGKDACNSTGSSDKEWIKDWYTKLENRLDQIAKVNPIYVYKNNEGLNKYDDIINWIQDPEGMVEEQFFKHHYPCGSFVVISKNGEYISYFGEYSKDTVWEAARILSR